MKKRIKITLTLQNQKKMIIFSNSKKREIPVAFEFGSPSVITKIVVGVINDFWKCSLKAAFKPPARSVVPPVRVELKMVSTCSGVRTCSYFCN